MAPNPTQKQSKQLRTAKAKPDIADPNAPERIAKVIARAGICSRRDAEKLIIQGRVDVDGKTIDSPALNITSKNIVLVDGEPLPGLEPTRLWRYHKPPGLVTSHKDPQERPTVFAALPDDLPRVVSIGRLDLNTEGLLLLTNDGSLARTLELPATGWIRRYRVRVYGRVKQDDLDKLKDGITVDGVNYGPIEANLDRQQRGNAWLTIALKEGKNREVKRIMESLGLKVNRLIRTSYGPFQLGGLKEGTIEEVSKSVLNSQLGRHMRKTGSTKTGNAKKKK